MSEESNETTPPEEIIKEDIDSNTEFYNAEFEGVASNEQRGHVADFGLPMNIGDISLKKTDEFESGGDVTRNIDVLEFQGNSLHKPITEYEVGASFQASEGLFKSKPDGLSDEIEYAPELPFFLEPSRTSFRSQNSLSKLRSDLEDAFAKCSVSFSNFDNACGYSCSALRQVTLVKIDVHIFDSENELLVELRQVSGCRYAYGEVTQLLAQTLEISFSETSSCLPLCPPELSEEAMAALPELKRTSSSCEVKFNEEVCTCEYAMQLVCEDAPRSTLIQGLRAIGTLVETLATAMNSCTHCGTCGAHHYNHERLFAKGGHWVTLAKRVGELANSDDEEVRTVAMAAVANIASLKHVCGKWLEETIPTLVAGANDDEPHVRREALRSIEAMASKNEKIAAKLVRAGAVPALELEANGGEDSQSPDYAMQAFAEGALLACRGENS